MSFATGSGVRTTLVALAFALPILPQQPGGSLAGVVSDGVTGSAIRGARVSLQLLGPENASALAVSDQSGRFFFGNLPPGRYRLTASRESYGRLSYGAHTPTQPGQIVTLVAGEAKQGLDFALPPLSAIAGTVLDESGDPMMRARVSLLRTSYPRGKPRLTPVRNAMTNDHGEYRMFDVPAGRYFLAATQDFPGLGLAPLFIANGRSQQQQERYPVEYYPNALDASSAAPVILEPGKELHGYDFRLSPQPAVRIKGHVVGPMDRLSNPEVTLAVATADPLGPGNFQRGFGAGPPDYAFEVPDIPPGSYLVMASLSGRDKETGHPVEFGLRQRLEVGSTGDDDLTLTLQPSVDISGSVRVEGEGAAEYKNLRVILSSGDEVMTHQSYRTQASADGTFTFKDVVPGIWDINVNPIPDGGYIKSMRLGEQDVLTEEMDIGPDSKGLLNIVVSTQGATIEGDIDNGGQPEDSRPIVLLAPDGRFHDVLSFYNVAVADEKGHFSMKALTPGAYRLFAFEDMEPNAYFDPDFLKPFNAQGTPVKLSEGANPSVKLKVIHTSAAPVKPQ